MEIANHIDVTDERRTYKHPGFCAMADADHFESDLSSMRLNREHDDVLLDTTIFVGLRSSPRTALCLGRRPLVASSLSVATMDMALVH